MMVGPNGVTCRRDNRRRSALLAVCLVCTYSFTGDGATRPASVLLFVAPSCENGAQLPKGHFVGSAQSASGRHRCQTLSTTRSLADEESAEVEVKLIEATVGTPPLQASANLAKNIVGSGMLSLPAGIAAFATGPGAILPSVLALVFPLGLLSAYTFYLVGWICEKTGTQSYGEAWGKLLGERSGRLVSLIVLLACASGCVAYAMILGDSLHLLLQPVTSSVLASRSSVITLITLFILYPLSRMKNLAPLGKFSLVGTFGSVFAALFTVIRYLEGSYAKGGRFASSAVTAAAGAPSKGALGTLVLASILSTAFIAHFNSPRMYKELEAPQKGGSKLRLFGGVVLAGFSVAMVLYATVMAFGYLTFGSSCLGNVLDNYAATDALAGVAKAAVATSLLFGHPLQFLAYRDGVESMTGLSGQVLSASLLASVTAVALLVRDLGKLQALQGAVAGTFLVFIGPSFMAAKLTKGRSRVRHLLVVGLGFLLGVAGVWVTLRG